MRWSLPLLNKQSWFSKTKTRQGWFSGLAIDSSNGKEAADSTTSVPASAASPAWHRERLWHEALEQASEETSVAAWSGWGGLLDGDGDDSAQANEPERLEIELDTSWLERDPMVLELRHRLEEPVSYDLVAGPSIAQRFRPFAWLAAGAALMWLWNRSATEHRDFERMQVTSERRSKPLKRRA